MGLLCAEQNAGNLNKCVVRHSGTPVRRTKRRKSQDMHFQKFWDSCAQNRTSKISKTCTFRNSSNRNKLRCLGQNLFGWDTPFWRPRFEPKSSQIHPRGLFWTALGAFLLLQTRRRNSLCDFTFSHMFIAISPVEAKFPSSF